MDNKTTPLVIALVFSLCSLAFAINIFPNQPRLSTAYDKVSSAITVLDKCSREGIWTPRINDAITKLGEAKTQLEQAAKNHGSARISAMKLIDQAKEGLSATPVTKANLEKAIQVCKDVLKKIVQAGG